MGCQGIKEFEACAVRFEVKYGLALSERAHGNTVEAALVGFGESP